MREIARRFRVVLHDPDENVTELRLQPQPLHRYASPSGRIQDGAIFSFVVATDPESLLIVEVAGEQRPPEWRCGFVRMHYWALTAFDSGGDEVWNAPLDLIQETNRAGELPAASQVYSTFHPRTPVLDSAHSQATP